MSIFKRKTKNDFEGGGLMLFEDVPQAIRAEKVLKKDGYQVRLVAPPPALRKGCDLSVEINLVEQTGIQRLFDARNLPYMEIAPLREKTANLLNVVAVTDFGDAVMVKAGNMKISFDKSTGIILNTSGGGCPDIPYLHTELVGRKLTEAPHPKDIGFTLCTLMADRALEECIKIWQEAKS